MRDYEHPLLAGVELGGTKSIALLARGRMIVARGQVQTAAPAVTLPALAAMLTAFQAEHGPAAALGIASFGPIRVQPAASDYGCLLETPKPGWSGADIRRALAAAVQGPCVVDTDVNGAALAEGLWGASQDCGVHIYLTIGTGIGGGVVANGGPLHGLLHPELGHVRVRRGPGDPFPGICPFHGDCLEGLASGPAIAARAGAPADQLPPEHPVWTRVSAEIGQAVADLLLVTAAERIVIGGGVAKAARICCHAFGPPRVRRSPIMAPPRRSKRLMP